MMGFISEKEAKRLKKNMRKLENLAMEFGFLAHKKGYTLEQARIEFAKLFKREND